MTDEAIALSLRDISRHFGSTLALEGAWCDARSGTLHALLGENGAGKSTLMRIAFGMLRPDAGTITVAGAPRRWRSSADAISAGIGMVHQHFLLVPAMTVAENVALGDRGALRLFDPRAAAERVRAISASAGLALDPGARAGDLSVGAQQRLEIVKALAHDANVLILDEPTAVLSPAESRELYAWLRSFVARGRTAILITHKVREALEIADDVTVLRQGRTVLSGRAAELAEDAVIAAMIGTALVRDEGSRVNGGARGGNRGDNRGGVIMAVDQVSATDANGVTKLRNASLDVHAGEIVGVAGVEGSGQHELLLLLAGRLAPSRGLVRLAPSTGFVPEDRLRDALIPAMSLVENLALKDAGNARGYMPWRDYEARTATTLREHDVRAGTIESPAGALSGGNQQKFVLGRELAGAPAALIVENPTRGLDVRATAHVMSALRDARAAGVAVVIYSSDVDELLAVADRVVVCFGAEVIEVDADAGAIGRAMVGSP